jgi:hypothetical protein
VKDEEAEPNTTNRYFLEAHNVLPLPRTASVREERALAQGTPVLGVRARSAEGACVPELRVLMGH